MGGNLHLFGAHVEAIQLLVAVRVRPEKVALCFTDVLHI